MICGDYKSMILDDGAALYMPLDGSLRDVVTGVSLTGAPLALAHGLGGRVCSVGRSPGPNSVSPRLPWPRVGQGWTVEIWLRSPWGRYGDTPYAYPGIVGGGYFSLGQDGGGVKNWSLTYGYLGGTLRYVCDLDSVRCQAETRFNQIPAKNKWTQVVAVWDGSATICTIFFDTILMPATYNNTDGINAGSVRISISGNSANGANLSGFTGPIQDLALYPFALRRSDIIRHFNARTMPHRSKSFAAVNTIIPRGLLAGRAV